jgi:hypothetical protein
MNEIEKVFLDFGYNKVTINNIINYELNGKYHKIAYMKNSFIIEVAENIEEAEKNRYQDADWYNSQGIDYDYIRVLKADMLKYYIPNNIDSLFKDFNKVIVNNEVNYEINDKYYMVIQNPDFNVFDLKYAYNYNNAQNNIYKTLRRYSLLAGEEVIDQISNDISKIDKKTGIYINEIKGKYKKINILCWCKCCDQGWVRIVKDTNTGKLLCECDETYALWASPEDYENDICIVNTQENQFELASEEEIKLQGWHLPINKVTTCRVCFFNTKPNNIPIPIRDNGWVVIKKDTDTGKLFCRCETCGSIWENIRDVLKKDRIAPSNIKIGNFQDAARDEIIAAGWDYYDNIYCIID